jgi:hypothetical protein
MFEPGYGPQLESILRPHQDWLLKQARGARRGLERDKPRNTPSFGDVAEAMGTLNRREAILN